MQPPLRRIGEFVSSTLWGGLSCGEEYNDMDDGDG